MGKKYLETNVYEEAQKRIAYIFDEFDNVLVAFSGGKDSGVCLNMCYDHAKKNNLIHKFAMYHLDYEAQYKMTTDYVDDTFKQFDDIKRYWICLPIGAQCCCRMDAGTWIPWETSKKDIWVRDMPEYNYVINESNCPFKFARGQADYKAQEHFSKWFGNEFGKTAVIIGLRAAESLNRYSTVKNEHRFNYNKIKYSTLLDKNTVNMYPIYDWETRDIWTYYGKFGKKYNKLYDLYYQAGLGIEQMRVASPFNDCASDTLNLYKAIDPNSWGKMVGRVNGVNFTSLYGGTTAMGWRDIKKPKHFTWKEYCYFLLDTLDEKTRQHYKQKLDTSIKFWKEKGGALSHDIVDELKKSETHFKNKGKTSKISDKDVIAFDDYPDDLNIKKFREVPTYKRMCICIMKNDYFCKYMGFAATQNEMKKRKNAMEMYSNL